MDTRDANWAELQADATPAGPICPVCSSPLQKLLRYSWGWVCEQTEAQALPEGAVGVLWPDWALALDPFSPAEAAELGTTLIGEGRL